MDTLETAAPKSVQVAEILRQEIVSLGLRPGARLQPARALAERFAVSKQVIQSAFAMLERDGVVESQVGRGTFVLPPTQSLARRTVLLLLQGTQDKHNRLPAVLASTLQKHGYIPYVFDTARSHEAATVANVKELLAERPRACVANAYGDFNYSLFDGLAPATHLVLLNHVEAGQRYPVASEVLTDFVETGRRACEHLLGKGRRRIAAVSFERCPGWSSDLFLTGAERALAARGLELFKCLDDRGDEATFFTEFSRGGCPDGVFCVSDAYIVRVKRAADACGLVLGRDYDAIGNGDTPWAEAYGIPSMDPRDEELASKVVEAIESSSRLKVSVPSVLAPRPEARQAA